MSRVVTVQLSSVVDNLWDAGDGELVEGTRLPYPWHVTEDGEVQRQDFWAGTVARVIGFTRRPEVRSIDLHWSDAWREPERAVGMYCVTANADGRWATWELAVESVAVTE